MKSFIGARWPRHMATCAMAWLVCGCSAYLFFLFSTTISKQSVYDGPVTVAIGACLANAAFCLMLAVPTVAWAIATQQPYRWRLVMEVVVATLVGVALMAVGNLQIEQSLRFSSEKQVDQVAGLASIKQKIV